MKKESYSFEKREDFYLLNGLEILVDIKGTVIAVNVPEDSYSTVERIVGEDLFSFLPDSILNSEIIEFRKLIQNGKPLVFDVRSGEDIFEWAFNPIFGKNQEIHALSFSCTPLSEKPEPEPKPHNEKPDERFIQITDILPFPMLILESEKPVYINKAFSQLFGYEIDVLDSVEKMLDLLFPDEVYRIHMGDEFDRAVRNPSSFFSLDEVYYITSSDGSKKSVSFWVVAVNKSHIMCIFQDVTSQKDGEILLRESEERFSRITAKLPLPLMLLDETNRPIYINKAFSSVFGYTLNDFSSIWKWYELSFPDEIYRAHIRSEIERAFRNPSAFFSLDEVYYVTCMDKTVKAVSFWLVPVGNNQKLCLFEDVTRRQIAESELRHSEERFSKIIQKVPFPLLLISAEGKVVYANPAATEMSGYSISNMEDWNAWSEYLFPNERYRKYVMKKWNQLELDSYDIRHTDEVYYITCMDGTMLSVLLWYVPIDHENRMLICEDVTKRKEVEEYLRKSEKRYKFLFSRMSNGFVLYDVVAGKENEEPDFRVLELNSAFEDYCDVMAEDVIGKLMSEVFPETYNKRLASYEQVIILGLPVQYEEYYKETGKYFHVYLYAPARGHIAAIFSDITSEKETEKLMQLQVDLSMALSETYTLKEALSIFCDAAINVAGMDCASVYILNENSGEFWLRHSVNVSDNFFFLNCAVSPMIIANDMFENQKIEYGKTLYTNYDNLIKTGYLLDSGEELKAVAFLPFFYKGSVLGFIFVGSHEVEEVETGVKRPLEVISSHIGGSIRRIKMQDSLLHRGKQFQESFMAMTRGFANAEIIYDDKKNPVDFRLLHVNPAFEEMVHKSQNELIDKLFSEIFPKRLEHWINQIKVLSNTSESNEFELYSERVERYFRCFVFELPTKGQIGIIMNDITEEVLIKEHKRDVLQVIEENLEQMSLLIDHIRTPLSVIVGHAEMQREDSLDVILEQAIEINGIVGTFDQNWVKSELLKEVIKEHYSNKSDAQ